MALWVLAYWWYVALVAAIAKTQAGSGPWRKIVVFRPGLDPASYESLLRGFGGRLAKTLPIADAAVALFPAGEARLETLAKHPQVTAVEDDCTVALCGAGQPAEEIPWGVARVEAPAAWSRSLGSGVKVGLIDTGVDLRHPDLQENLKGGINLLCPGQPPTDDNGHGTHVAGILAAARNGRGVVGVAPGAGLYVVKAFDRYGNGRLSRILEALQWCADQRLHLVNLSFGMKQESVALRRAVQKATATGLLVVAAAGNEGRADSVVYPARYSEVLAVAALGKDGRRARFSSFGPEIDFIAPGEDIKSTYPGGRYRVLSGTSMAAPHVTGIAALLLGARLQLRGGEVRQLLVASCRPIANLPREEQGAGLPSARQAVQALLAGQRARAS